MSDLPRQLLAFHDWHGSAYEIGAQHGKTLARQIVAECQPALDAAVASGKQTAEAFLCRYRECYEPVFQEVVPRAIDEIRGIAGGSGLAYEHAFFAATRDGAKLAERSRDACTAFYCARSTTADGHVLIGQNKDTDAPLNRYHLMRRVYDDGPAVLTLNYPGWIANIGLNAHGVGCTGNSLYARPAEVLTVPFSLMRYLTAEAESTADVAAWADWLAIENCCMIVADAAGEAFCLESVAGRQERRDIAGQAFGHANSILSPDLQMYEDTALYSPSSPCRQRNIQRHLDATRGRLDVALLQTILSDHADHPHGICRHTAADDPIVTTAALVADCTSRTIRVALGNPCTAEFQTYSVDS